MSKEASETGTITLRVKCSDCGGLLDAWIDHGKENDDIYATGGRGRCRPPTFGRFPILFVERCKECQRIDAKRASAAPPPATPT